MAVRAMKNEKGREQFLLIDVAVVSATYLRSSCQAHLQGQSNTLLWIHRRQSSPLPGIYLRFQPSETGVLFSVSISTDTNDLARSFPRASNTGVEGQDRNRLD
jgi:hypothetical protein